MFFHIGLKVFFTPLIKKSSLPSEYVKDYCFVSGISFPSKLIDLVVATQFNSPINTNQLDNPSLSVYISGHSTETVMLCINREENISLAHCSHPS